MREVIARQEHICQKCGEPIEIGENCIQSESRFYQFWHFGCYDKPIKVFSETTIAKS